MLAERFSIKYRIKNMKKNNFKQVGKIKNLSDGEKLDEILRMLKELEVRNKQILPYYPNIPNYPNTPLPIPSFPTPNYPFPSNIPNNNMYQCGACGMWIVGNTTHVCGGGATLGGAL